MVGPVVARAEHAATRAEHAADRVAGAAERIEQLLTEPPALDGAQSEPPGPAAPFIVEPAPPATVTAQDLTLDEWQQRLEQLDPEGGVYVRVMRIGEGRELTWIANLHDPKGNLEEQIERAAQAKNIAGPEVRFRLQPSSRRGYLRNLDGTSAIYELRMAIAPAPPPPPAAGATVGPAPLGVKEVFEVADRIDARVRAEAPNAPDPQAMVTAVIDAASKLAAASTGPTKEIVTLLTPVVGKVAERLFNPPPPVNPVTMLKEMREAGLLPALPTAGAADEDPLARFETLLDLGERFAERLGGRGAGDRVTLGVEAVRIIGPPVVRVLDRGVDAFNNWINFRRERLYFESGARRVPTRPAARRPAEPAATPEAIAAAGAQAELVAILQAAAPRAQANDASYYPELRAALTARVPGCGELLEDLRGGRVTDVQAFDALGALNIEILEPLAGYLRRFLGWARTAPAAAAAPPKPAAAPAATPAREPEIITAAPLGVVGRCEHCGAEYNYRTRAELETDDSPCDAALDGRACGGRIVAAEATP